MKIVSFEQTGFMKRPGRILVLLASAIVLLGTGASCHHKTNTKSACEESPGSCQSVLAAKNFFLFKEGSWWVYEEETSHARDSMYVTEYINSTGYDFDCSVKSALTEYEYEYWPLYAGGSQSCSQVAPINGKCLFIKRSKGKPGDFVDEGYCFFVNYKTGDYLGSFNSYFENNMISVLEKHDQYELGELDFQQTVVIHELNTFMEGHQPTNHYFAKNVGLIRKELLDSNQVWNLVSYHIEP